MKLRLLLSVPTAFLLSSAAKTLAVDYIGRVGLYSSPEFVRSGDHFQFSGALGLTDSGWVYGYTVRYNGAREAGAAAWVVGAVPGAVTRRLGLFESPEFTAMDGAQTTGIRAVTESGWIHGESAVPRQGGQAATALWLAQASTGVSRRVGLFSGPEFAPAGGVMPGSITGYAWSLTESGCLLGSSKRYGGGEGADAGQAVWMADAATGLTTRLGFWGTPEYTRGNDGYQFSDVGNITQSGYIHGGSSRYNEDSPVGQAVWLAEAATGISRRVGCFAEPEFTRADGTQYTYSSSRLTESGYINGVSIRYRGGDPAGQAVWVAEAATGNTRRIGFFNGPEFTRGTDNYQNSDAVGLAEKGWVSGHSNLYNGTAYAGSAAWVADAGTGAVRRVGLTGGVFARSGDNLQHSTASGDITESGFLTGYSLLFKGTADGGRAAWVADAATGVTRRVGLYTGAEYTGGSLPWSALKPGGVTESGYLAGTSVRYSSNSSAGQAAWTAVAATGATKRVGLTGSEFRRSSDDYQYHEVERLAESGWVSGFTQRFKGAADAGRALWVADGATGSTRRVGLFSSRFTRSDGYQESSISDWSLFERGLLAGDSKLYAGANEFGQAVWTADAATGVTTRMGSHDAMHTGVNDYQFSKITAVSKSGAVAGYSERYNGGEVKLGVTAWVYDPIHRAQASFDISVRKGDFYSSSTIDGVTDDGAVFGSFQLFDGPNAGPHGFVWMAGLGTVIPDESITGGVAALGWKALTDITGVAPSGLLTGNAELPDGGGQGAFVASLTGAQVSAVITGITRSDTGEWDLAFQAESGSRWMLQSSASLASWTDGPVTEAGPGITHIGINAGEPAGARFWRLKRVP